MDSHCVFNEGLDPLDLSSVRSHLIATMGWTSETADLGVDLYRKWLAMRDATVEQVLAPPALVDEVWHAHILDTRKYRDDCERFLGGYLDHDPNPDDGLHSAAWRRTVEAYRFLYKVDLEQADDPRLRRPGRSF